MLFFLRRVYHFFGGVYLDVTMDTAMRFDVICYAHQVQLDAILSEWMEQVSDEELLAVIERLKE